MDIFRYRLRVWARSLLRIVELHRSAIPVRTLHLWFLGDILENEYIWKGQGAYIETGLMQQFFMAMYEVAQVVGILSSNFERILIKAIHGNHGRGRERRRSTKTWMNWEFLWYRYLELVCRDLPNVEFDLGLSWFDLANVFDFTFLLLHGEDIIRYMKFPWYSINELDKAYAAIMQRVGHPFEVMVFGHHHISANFQTSKGEWYCNGNWVGGTMYSLKVLRDMATPKQWLLFCHPKRAIASRWPIDLMLEDAEIWKEVKRTSYDIHVPVSNRDLLAAMNESAKRAAWTHEHPRRFNQ